MKTDIYSENIHKTLISIIIPCYNAEKWLEDAINSCLNQTYQYTEIIIVNDGSNDRTEEIALTYVSRNEHRFKYIPKSRGGSSSARNKGIEIAEGDYYIFLDADDVLLYNSIEKLLIGIEDTNSDAAFGDWINFKEESEQEEYISARPFFSSDILASLIKKPMVISAIMIRRNDQRWNENRIVNEVFEYFFTLFSVYPNIIYIDAPVTKIRQHLSKNRITIAHEHYEPFGRIQLLYWYKNLLIHNHLLNDARNAALDEKLTFHLIVAKQRNIYIDDCYYDIVDTNSIRKYYWYNIFKISGFIGFLGVKKGINWYVRVEKILRRMIKPLAHIKSSIYTFCCIDKGYSQ